MKCKLFVRTFYRHTGVHYYTLRYILVHICYYLKEFRTKTGHTFGTLHYLHNKHFTLHWGVTLHYILHIITGRHIIFHYIHYITLLHTTLHELITLHT